MISKTIYFIDLTDFYKKLYLNFIFLYFFLFLLDSLFFYYLFEIFIF